MLSCIKHIIFIFLSVGLFADVNFTNPTTVTGGVVPDLSDETFLAIGGQVVTSSTGQYVYATWEALTVTGHLTIQVVRSADYGVTWVIPTSTPVGAGTFNLSDNTEDAEFPQIATSASGRYVYVDWTRNNGAVDVVQVAISSDYGDNWVNPTATTEGTPNLSVNNRNAYDPQITTSSTGQYVYAIWDRVDGGVYNVVQVSISTDYGDNWVDPTTTTGDAVPDLSKGPILGQGGNADAPQITTSSTGQYVYAVWQRNNGTNTIVQVSISTDYGDNWVDPTTVTGDYTASLSKNGGNADVPQITTSSTGQYVYTIWQRNDGSKTIVQVALSSDYGDNWVNPTTTTGDHTASLSKDGQNADVPQITTSSTGQYVYAIWQRSDGSNTIVQVVLSLDYGVNWINPTAVTGDHTANLSADGGDADNPQIATSSTGEYIYAVWQRNDGSNPIVQIAISASYGVKWSNPTTVTGDHIPNLSVDGFDAIYPQIAISSDGEYIYSVWYLLIVGPFSYAIQEANGRNTTIDVALQVSKAQEKIRFPFQIDFTNNLTWNALPEAIFYRVYSDAALANLLAETNKAEFVDHQIKKDERKTYYVTWIDSNYVENGPTVVNVP